MKTKLLALLLLLPFLSIGQQYKLITATEANITIDIQVPEYQAHAVMTPQGEAFVITAPEAMNCAKAGEPDLPILVIPTMIGDDALMTVNVIQSEYTDYENMEIAPSKGDFPRSIDPDEVPYTYGEAFQKNAFFPSQLAKLDEPYIHRDVRGQNIVLYPYSYNPVTKILRVFTHVVVSMTNIGKDTRNVISQRTKSTKLDPEFKAMYQNRYINFAESMSKYNPTEENGELLIICHDAFMDAMQPFVAWKKQIGRPTTMVGTSATGTSATSIKSYIETYYVSCPNLTDILLVGDVAQIPGVYVSAYDYSGYGDLPYGQLAGNDYYNEVIVGRFCCETEDQVTNHVNKVLNYERDLDETATWLTVGQGVSTNSQSGHYGESDYQHIDNIRNDLLDYNYTNVYRDYNGVSGSTAPNSAAVSQHINQGVSIINYCNHGNETSWGVFSYSNSNVNALTNDYKLPYIISVACRNGKYDHGGNGCFAEAWMRATNNNNGTPTGAIGGMFSYISQPWTPPQYGQDEMIDILVESYSNNIKRTMGGVSVNGNMKVLDQGASQNDVKGTYNCWILFGDPTLMLRNAVPTDMLVSHSYTIDTNSTSFTVNALQGEGALATLTKDGEIMGSATINDGSATIQFSAPETEGVATLTVFGYNKMTYSSTIIIGSGGSIYPITLNVAARDSIIALGGSTQLHAYATGGNGIFTYNWTPAASLNNPSIANPTAIPGVTTTYTCTVTSGDQTQTGSCTVTVVCPPTNLTASVVNDNGIELNWEAANLASSYTIYLNGVETFNRITDTTFTIPDNQPGIYQFEVAAKYQGIISPKSNTATVTIEESVCPQPENFNGKYYWSEGEFGARLAWDKAEYEFTLDRFEIYRSTDGENFKLVDRIVNTPSITHYECLDVLMDAGNYIYRIIAFYQNNCESDPLDIDITITSVDSQTISQVNLYPNPTSGLITLTSENLKQINIINSLGQTLRCIKAENDNVSIDMSIFGKGIYLLKIEAGNSVLTKKVIVE